ncbi:phytochelatin synthase [Acanthamoeba castellanii str. Neff]|uniref:glutathione gamma-glutamylcysteinyltransferase n=1 Tax=Acanthamoeba castellanii (strain ATCC 30010 / Neff) TaxID=1257118 RepID=L8HB52_ACACF|nr:phytochelatin synthase [Acanthamoeba castellanii str. Neff]ELR22440.1 phytochelatin synthase [Acanthamoeba castellanii str. Neff]
MEKKEQQKEQQGFYRRPLPDVEPAYCGLGTLAMVLNALAIDPQRIWKGPWRWFSEELLDCCSPLEVVKKNGITISEFVCLAMIMVEGDADDDDDVTWGGWWSVSALQRDVDQFREVVRECSARDDRLLVVSYDRRGLKQTGSGHFSPIGGYHPDKDMVLILDVARFKYPPHWVSLPTLFAAMQTIDSASQRSRGYISVTAAPQRPHIFSRIRAGSGEWAQLVDRLCNQLPALFAHNRLQQSAADSPAPPPVVELPEFVATALAYITAPSPSLLTSASSLSSCAISDFFSTYEKDLQDRMTVEHRQMVKQLFDEIHSTDIYRALDATDTASRRIGGGGEAACCRVSTVHDEDRKKPTTASSSPATIPGELATLILFLLLRQLDETKHHQQQQQEQVQEPEAASSSSSSTSSPAPACSSCTASLGPKQQQQRQEPHDGCARASEVRFGESVAAAFKQLDALPLVSGEVGYLWASFRNIAFFCACRDRRTPCH